MAEPGFEKVQCSLKLLLFSSSLNPFFLSSGRDLERSKGQRQWRDETWLNVISKGKAGTAVVLKVPKLNKSVG